MMRAGSEQEPHISALLLAAGRSSRFGDDNKLLTNWRGQFLIHHVLSSIAESNVVDITVITGHQHELVTDAIKKASYDKPIFTFHNCAYRTGMASSLIHGVSTLINSDAIVVCLGDMPNVGSNVINKLVQTYENCREKRMFIPVHQGRRGNPVLIANGFFDAVLESKDDIGARALAQRRPESVQEVPVECSGIHQDIDTRQELRDLE